MPTQRLASDSHIIVCGAGIGGLTSALCLAKQGFKVTVVEQARQISEVGAGIQLGPNAMRVMRYLGLEEYIIKQGFLPQALQMRNGTDGSLIAQLKLKPELKMPWNGHYVNIHRADLIRILLAAAHATTSISIKLNTVVSAYLHNNKQAAIVTAADDKLEADLIIGADGIHSKIRESMHGKSTARYTGHRAWRLTLPTAQLGPYAPPETACVWFGDNKHAVTYRLANGEISNFVGVVESDSWAQESWSYQGKKADAMHDFEGWDPIITQIVAKADNHFQWALMDRPVLQEWVDGPVALLGDACHPMLPFMAQGAAMAIEDAMVLSRCLHKLETDFALQRYQQLRRSRTEKVWQLANKNAALYHQHGTFSSLQKLKLGFGSRLLPNVAVAASQFNWLYGYDATRVPID